MAETALFWIFGIGMILSACAVVAHRNAVYSALFLVISFFCVSGLYLIQGAQFVAALQIIVYAGAIMVLIVFVIMLLNLQAEAVEIHKNAFQRTAGLIFGTLLGVLMVGVSLRANEIGPKGEFTREAILAMGNSETLGMAMFTRYVYPFEIVSLILLAAMVGSIVLAKRNL